MEASDKRFDVWELMTGLVYADTPTGYKELTCSHLYPIERIEHNLWVIVWNSRQFEIGVSGLADKLLCHIAVTFKDFSIINLRCARSFGVRTLVIFKVCSLKWEIKNSVWFYFCKLSCIYIGIWVCRCGVNSQTGWWDILVGSTCGTMKWESGNMSLNGLMKCQWCWLELHSTIRYN